MRLILCALTLIPLPLLADTYTVASAPTAVTVYPDSALVTRDITVDIAAGQHEILLPDLPRWIDPADLRVTVVGAVLGATRLRSDALPPQPDRDSPAITAARAAVRAAEQALEQLDDRTTDARQAAVAAEARQTFLSGLWSSQTLPAGADALAALGQMIEDQTLDALRAKAEAERQARAIASERPALEADLADARAALAALMPRDGEQALLTLAVTAPAAGPITATVRYPVDAFWEPTYDIRLTRQDTPTLTLDRGAIVTQNSDEAWEEVALTLSTLQPTGQIAPSVLIPPLLRYGDPMAPRPVQRMLSADAPEAMMVAEAAPARARFDGPGVRYEAPDPVTLAPGAEGTRVALDRLRYDARLFARAIPARDSTAFLMAEAVNDSAEPLLPAASAQVFVDGSLVGRTPFAAVPAGGEIRQGFGPLEDLRLTRIVLDRSEGDHGLISRNSARVEAVRLRIENLGQETWQVELQEAVPYSEQDDLRIAWTSDPAADVDGAEDRRGLLQWNFPLAAGQSEEIMLEQTIRWPEGKVLQ